MRGRLSLLLLLLGIHHLPATPPPGYYDPAQGKSGQALRQALHEIIKNHTVILYDSNSSLDTVDAVKDLDEDPADTNNVILIYSGWTASKASYGVNGWNREHLWPNSYGFDIDVTTTWPALRDLFNLRTCDSRVNSARGNKFYDESDPNDPNYRNPAHTNAPLCSTDTDSWEPPDSMKGDIARALFYMDVRYAGHLTNEADLVLTDNIASIASGNPFMGRLGPLLLWHRSDSVDGTEQRRNDLIYQQYQHNRNPFVDHPEWVESVYLPTLFISRQASGVTISWESNWTNVVLQSASPVSAAWSPFPLIATNVGSQPSVFVVITNAQQFFRLELK